MTPHDRQSALAGDLRTVRAACDREPVAAAMLDTVRRRAVRWTAHPSVTRPDERAGWWHVVWERLGDVAFLQAWEPDAQRAAWLRAEVLRICALDAEDWLGPFFRPKTPPLLGSIETGHIGVAIADVLHLCPELFDGADVTAIADAVTEKGLVPTRRWLDRFDEGADELNNHYLAHLNGYAAMALLTSSTADLETLPRRLDVAASLFQDDSYPESVQYWGYAALHFANLFRILSATGLVDSRWLRVAAGALPWVAHSMLFPQTESPWGAGRHVSLLNFGDSALTGRPPADALLCFARHLRRADPMRAGLARWLFDETYADVEVAPEDLASFGFFNQVGWRSVVDLAAAAAPLSPDDAQLPTCDTFRFGTVIERDRWTDPRTVLAARNGHDRLTTPSHRHRDEGSFVLGHRGEVLFTDPGHCCYRLHAYQRAKDSSVHSTWTLFDEGGRQIDQTVALGSEALGERYAPRRVDHDGLGALTVFGADVGAAYPSPVERATRMWITCLPHLVVIVDDIETSTPTTVETRFLLDNRENRLRTEGGSETLVLRRGGAGAMLARLESRTDGGPSEGPVLTSWTAVHDVYDPLPNAAGQGKEGSGVIHGFSTSVAGLRHRAVYAIALDEAARIGEWRLGYADGSVLEVVSRDGTRWNLDVDDTLARSRS